MDLVRYVVDSVNRHWTEEVQILGIWKDGPAAACFVYRRTIDPSIILGSRFEFHAKAADGTIEGFVRDVAINLAEPIGAAKTRQDQHGIIWVGVPEDRQTPEPPSEVVGALSDN
jgi:hypothetical protein